MATRLIDHPERRREPRVAERVALAIREAGNELATQTNNLSASGAYCTLDRFIAPMSKLQLRLTLPSDGRHPTQIRCSGVVVRVEPVIHTAHRGGYHVAVLFTDLTARDRSAIGRFVRQRVQSATSGSQ